MDEKVLFIRNMVCNRCVMAVENMLNKMDIGFTSVQLGEVQLKHALTDAQKEALSGELQRIGFDLIDSRISGVIEKIKQLTIKRARNQVSEEEAKLKLSVFLSQQLHHEYTYLSSIFSSIESRTIENYFIEQRIEYVKELLVYGELSLSQIAMKLEYSSTAHLSAQFKKVTGLTPSYYKQVGANKRKALDQV